MNQFKFDTHMHLDLYKDRKKVLNYIEEQKSYTIAVTNLPILFEKYINSYGDYKYTRFALGFHPELVNKYKGELNVFLKNIKNTRYIGEVGLDYTTKDIENRNSQYNVFKTISEACNSAGDKILSVHSRKATKEVNEILNGINSKVIMHWFTGNKTELEQSINQGFYFSINHQMISSNTSRELINRIPINRLLIESDAPFTSGLRKEYDLYFINEIYLFLANLYSKKVIDIEKQLKNNLQTLLIFK